VRLLVWNMGSGSPGVSPGYEDAWRYLCERDDFDVALLQETPEPPSWVRDEGGSYVWRPKYANRRHRRRLWGSAVIARSMQLQPFEPDGQHPWLQALPGSTAIARSQDDPGWLVSVHLHARRIDQSLLDSVPLDGIEVTTPDGSIWETNVIPQELHRLFGGETFVWGGDFNSDPRMDEIGPPFIGGNRRCFEIYSKSGSVDARARLYDEYQRTYFAPRRRAYQLDHVFVDEQTSKRVVAWYVDESPAKAEPPLSDHAPILVQLK
jgi:endonuclease/exonuclease/phosphatase (EEP) superfamily protein YafD